MWMGFALGSAVFAGATAVLAKKGAKNIDADVATAIRSSVVLVLAWGIAALIGAIDGLAQISGKTLLFLALSGIATGASWIFYMKALRLGKVAGVAAIDKSSVVLTVVLAAIFFAEEITVLKAAGVAAILAGMLLMIEKNAAERKVYSNPARWMVYALLSAAFASLTSILGKVGIRNVESNLGTAIRTVFVFMMAGIIVFGKGKQKEAGRIDRRDALFLALSGVATGGSWLCYYRALQEGPASVVAPIDKLSIVVSVILARIFLKEKAGRRTVWSAALITAGTIMVIL